MPYPLVSRTVDLGKDGSRWAHGYLPLNAAAEALKLHRPASGGSSKSRLSTSTVRPSRLKLKSEKGRTSSNPFQRAVDRGDINPTGREHLGGGVHGEAAARLSNEHAQVKRAFPDRTTPDGFTIKHTAEVGDNKRPTGAFNVSVFDKAHPKTGQLTAESNSAGKRYTKISDGTSAEIDALGRARDKRRGGKELDSRYVSGSKADRAKAVKPESAAGDKKPYDPEAWRAANARGNAIAQAKLDAGRAARSAASGSSSESVADVGTRLHGADRTRWKVGELRTQAQFGDTAAKAELARRANKRATRKASAAAIGNRHLTPIVIKLKRP